MEYNNHFHDGIILIIIYELQLTNMLGRCSSVVDFRNLTIREYRQRNNLITIWIPNIKV